MLTLVFAVIGGAGLMVFVGFLWRRTRERRERDIAAFCPRLRGAADVTFIYSASGRCIGVERCSGGEGRCDLDCMKERVPADLKRPAS